LNELQEIELERRPIENPHVAGSIPAPGTSLTSYPNFQLLALALTGPSCLSNALFAVGQLWLR
jgi:hypothetical protein